jgi:hypothetical protein
MLNQWCALNLWIPLKTGDFLTSSVTSSFSKRFLFRTVILEDREFCSRNMHSIVSSDVYNAVGIIYSPILKNCI